MDITGIADMAKVHTAANNYKNALIKAKSSVEDTIVNNAMKGSGVKTAFSSYQTAVNNKVESIIKIIDKLIQSIDEVKDNYDSKTSSASTLGTAAKRLS